MDVFIFLSIILEHLWESLVGDSYWPFDKMFEISYRIYIVFCFKILQFKCSPFEVCLCDDIFSWQMPKPYVTGEKNALTPDMSRRQIAAVKDKICKAAIKGFNSFD